ncbi:hypothetical protein TNCT1_65890 [Streptomyces sp. 1-11]|nr:hypothetical protein TNCT1_65890 [Streptomyces sp. 1-11]
MPGRSASAAGLPFSLALAPIRPRPTAAPISLLPQQLGYTKRLNAAGPLISCVIEAMARQVPT